MPESHQEPTVSLTDEQIAFYHEKGYLVLPVITGPGELDPMIAAYDRIFRERSGRETGDQFDLAGIDDDDDSASLPQILGPSRFAPELRDGLFRVNAAAVTLALLGPEGAVGGDHAIFKPARTGAATPWHQDEAYWDPSLDYNSFSLWIPLQDATVENGCMWFVPGSHRWPVLPHHSIGHDPRIHGLEVDAADTSTAVACPIPAGAATVHHNRTLHYTGPNTSDTPRRALIIGCGLPAKPASEKRDFYWNTMKQTPREERARRARSSAPAA